MIHEACPSSGTEKEKKKHDETLVPNSGFNPDRRRGAPPFPSHHDPPTRLPPIDAIHGQLPSAAPPTAASSSRRLISDGVGVGARASDTGGKGPEVLFLECAAESRAAPSVRPANPRCRSRKPGTPPVQPRQERHGDGSHGSVFAPVVSSHPSDHPTIRGSIIHVVSPMRLLGGVPRNWLGSYAYC